jgi:hypothetical protein
MNDDDLEKYKYLWDGTDPGWVLVKAPKLAGGFCIYNKQGRTILHVESKDLNVALCEQLRKKGVEILDQVLPGKVDVKPKQ